MLQGDDSPLPCLCKGSVCSRLLPKASQDCWVRFTPEEKKQDSHQKKKQDSHQKKKQISSGDWCYDTAGSNHAKCEGLVSRGKCEWYAFSAEELGDVDYECSRLTNFIPGEGI